MLRNCVFGGGTIKPSRLRSLTYINQNPRSMDNIFTPPHPYCRLRLPWCIIAGSFIFSANLMDSKYNVKIHNFTVDGFDSCRHLWASMCIQMLIHTFRSMNTQTDRHSYDYSRQLTSWIPLFSHLLASHTITRQSVRWARKNSERFRTSETFGRTFVHSF